jgi:hypothetical protein
MSQEFKLIVAGGRDFTDAALLNKTILEYAENHPGWVSIVSGMASGADRLAWVFAKKQRVKVYEFPANWAEHGRSAGFIRNRAMADFSHGLLAFWNGSRGTRHMIETMQSLNKPITVIQY